MTGDTQAVANMNTLVVTFLLLFGSQNIVEIYTIQFKSGNKLLSCINHKISWKYIQLSLITNFQAILSSK